MHYDIAVVGAGASGLVAALVASRAGAAVCLLERNERIGRKILATGNGRCNLANVNMDDTHFHSYDPVFVRAVLRTVGLRQVLDFFASLGLEIVEEDSRIYPMSMQAASVLDVLRHEVDRLGIATMTNARVERITRSGNCFKVHIEAHKCLEVAKLVLATGGKAAPKLGTTGDGYDMAASLGHRLFDPVPALVGLRLSSPHLKGLAGVRIHATVSISELNIEHAGEVLFTDYGLSGIPVFDLSAGASRAFRSGTALHLVINLLPGSIEAVCARLRQRFALLKYKSSLDALIGLLPKQLGPALLKDAGFSSLHKPASEVTEQEFVALAGLLHSWRFAIVDHNGWLHAQTTAGGVDLSQVSPGDLQSKICPGLYFAGELLDVHGDCGGYNLMWAWSSGMLAGRNAATRS